MAPTMARAPAILPMTVPAIAPGLVLRLPPSLTCGLLSIDIMGSDELVVLLKMLVDAASVLLLKRTMATIYPLTETCFCIIPRDALRTSHFTCRCPEPLPRNKRKAKYATTKKREVPCRLYGSVYIFVEHLFLYTQSVRLLSVFSAVFLFRCPVTHNFSNTAATSTHLSNTALVSFAFFVTNRTQFYLLLLHCIVISIYACQGLRVPSKLVVARVCVDDSGAIIASRDFGSALWICLGGNRGDKRHQSGDNQLHDGFVMIKLSLCKSC
jgi:hypothetical protein